MNQDRSDKYTSIFLIATYARKMIFLDNYVQLDILKVPI